MNRRELREQLFMLLFRKEFHDDSQMDAQLELYFNDMEDPSADDEVAIKQKDINLITEKCRKILLNLPEIDRLLSENTEKWSLSRIGKTELSILRLALYEILYDESIPTGVAINEAVELSKKFCQDGAGSFINGILAKFANNASDAKNKDTGASDKSEKTPVQEASNPEDVSLNEQ